MRTLTRPPLDLLFGAYRSKILSLLLLHPDQSYYVREISRLTRVPAGSLHRELRLLADAGILIRSASGNQVRYQARRECPIYEDLASLLRKTAGLADVLRRALSRLAPAIDVAFVFGSLARGKERAASDVDVAVIGESPFESVVEALSDAQERLRREVNPVVMTTAAFRSKYRRHDRFVSRIVREPKIFLIGSSNDLAELTLDRAAERTSS